MARPPRESLAQRRARRAGVDDPAEVLAAAARLLEARPRSADEVRRRLRDAGYRPELVEGAVSRLAELGYLDDEAFARAWVESRDRARPRGARVLRDELRRKGVAGPTVEAVLAARDDQADDAEEDADERAAAALLERRAASLARIADPRLRRQRAYALLARNGFDPEIAGRVAGRFAAAEGE
jgi:regulatory protein